MPPLRPGDAVLLIAADAPAQHGVVEAIASWEWIRVRVGATYWLNVEVPSGIVSWSVLCRLHGPVDDADCARVAQAVITREHRKAERGKVADIPGLAELHPPDWRITRN